MLGSANEWVRVVPNEKERDARDLTPTAVTGTLQVPVGRLRKLAMGGDYLHGVHRRRSVAVGRRRAAAADVAHRARVERQRTARAVERLGTALTRRSKGLPSAALLA